MTSPRWTKPRTKLMCTFIGADLIRSANGSDEQRYRMSRAIDRKLTSPKTSYVDFIFMQWCFVLPIKPTFHGQYPSLYQRSSITNNATITNNKMFRHRDELTDAPYVVRVQTMQASVEELHKYNKYLVNRVKPMFVLMLTKTTPNYSHQWLWKYHQVLIKRMRLWNDQHTVCTNNANPYRHRWKRNIKA